MPDIERQGARIHYEVSGDGPTVVLGHSLLCDGHMWDDVLPILAERYRVINVDARGHRHSSSAGAFSLDDLADDWLAILDREKVDQAALCGLSMGGMTAMRLALAHPDRVAALALLDTSADAEKPAFRVQFQVMATVVRHMGFVGLLGRKTAEIMFGASARRHQPDLVARELDEVRKKDREGIYWAIRAVAERDSIRSRLDELRCPTRVIVGDEDRATPPVLSRRIAAGIPGAVLVTLPAIGHLSALEAPEPVVDALREFLDSLCWS